MSKKQKSIVPTLTEICAFESGTMQEEEQVVDFFQRLIDSGLAWELQGTYGRTAVDLIKQGKCRASND